MHLRRKISTFWVLPFSAFIISVSWRLVKTHNEILLGVGLSIEPKTSCFRPPRLSVKFIITYHYKVFTIGSTTSDKINTFNSRVGWTSCSDNCHCILFGPVSWSTDSQVSEGGCGFCMERSGTVAVMPMIITGRHQRSGATTEIEAGGGTCTPGWYLCTPLAAVHPYYAFHCWN